ARRPPPPARRGRGGVQRGDAAGRRDPRDHAGGAGRRRRRDRLGRDRGHGQRDRDDGHRLPPERRGVALAAAARAGRAPLAVLLPPRRRRPAGRARARRGGARGAERLDRPADPACERRRRRDPRRHARGARGLAERGARGDRGARGRAAAAAAVPGGVGAGGDGARMGVIARWRDRLPVTGATPELSLGEGGTPLVRSERLSARLGVELWFKLEGTNPTGSFKDRGMVVAVAKALEEGAQGIVCASTGNTAASAAAYAARAGVPAVVLTP